MTDETHLKRQAEKPPKKAEFDQSERDELRAVLLRYARENGIGSPNLQSRIAKASKRPSHQIPLKTLQRFLKNEGRTNDGFLIPCFEFAASIGEMGPHDELTRDLGEFFSRGEIEGRAADEVPERLAGSYEVWEGGSGLANFKVMTAEGAKSDKPYGRCSLIVRGRGLKVYETETGPGSGGKGGAFRPAANEGMALFFDPLVFVLLKNHLTRLPRVYWLREGKEDRLIGHGMQGEPIHSGNPEIPYSHFRNFELRRTSKDGQ
jgi:hypothetical protein